jgi:hypothetical protein
MDQIDINEMIFDLSVVLNKLAQAKKDAQKHMQGCDDPDNLQARVDRLEDTLADVSYDLDTARDDLYKLVDMLEEKKFKMDMDKLSQEVTAK